MKRGTVKYLEGRYKCFLLDVVNFYRARVLRIEDGKVYNVSLKDLYQMPY
jgi:hypothetical protein